MPSPLNLIVVLTLYGLALMVPAASDALRSVPRDVLAAATAQGYAPAARFRQVELPLGLPILVGGVRGATVQVVATAMLAAYVGAGGLGRYIFLGLGSQDYPQMIAGSLLVIALALLLDLALLAVQRLTAPRGTAPAR